MSSKKRKRKTPQIERIFLRYLEDENSAGFIRAVACRYSEPTLQRLAQRGRRGTRRAAVMALGFFGSDASNAVLGEALRDRDRAVRLLAENGIRSLWTRAAGEFYCRRIEAIAWLNYAQRFEEVVDDTSQMIANVPCFSEAWNQRAIAYFGLGEWARAIEDCRQTLTVNKYHFLAESGQGNCLLRLRDPASALDCFRRALHLNPALDGVRAQIDRLQRTMG